MLSYNRFTILQASVITLHWKCKVSPVRLRLTGPFRAAISPLSPPQERLWLTGPVRPAALPPLLSERLRLTGPLGPSLFVYLCALFVLYSHVPFLSCVPLNLHGVFICDSLLITSKFKFTCNCWPSTGYNGLYFIVCPSELLNSRWRMCDVSNSHNISRCHGTDGITLGFCSR